METLLSLFNSAFSNIGPFFILLGLLIFVHELGHFAVAKFFGVRVEVFSLGFGKKIFQYKKGDTNYCISLIPLGGYVKMFGDDPNATVPEEDKPHSFLHKPIGQRVAVVLAGPLMNLFFAAVLFILIAVVGEEVPGSKIGDVQPGTTAHEAGFRSGDNIQAINGEETETWKQIQEKIEASINKSLTFKVARAGSDETTEFTVTPVAGNNENILSTEDQVGVIPGLDLQSLSSLIGVADTSSPAAQAGLKPLDLILSINGEEVLYYRHIESLLKKAAVGSTQVQIEAKAYDLEKETEKRTVTLNVPQFLVEPESWTQALGIEPASLYLLKVKEDSPAGKAGLKPGDKILTVNGNSIENWPELIEQVKNYESDQRGMELTYLRDGKTHALTIVPEMTALMNAKGQEEQRYTIGIISGYIHTPPPPVLYKVTSPVKAVTVGLEKTAEWTGMLVMGIVRLIQGEVSVRNIGGVITIGRFASHSFEAGLSAFMKMMAIISLNLFMINLLPIPVLDGGHLVFYCIEAFKGAPLSMRKMEIAQQVGLVILITLMVFSFYNDINNFFFSSW